MLQNRQAHLKNPAALYKMFRVFDHPGKLYDKEFRDVIVCYFFYFNQMVFKSSFKKWG